MKGNKDGIDTRCKTCHVNNLRLVKELKKNAPKMPDVCECCKKPSSKSLQLDHCHQTKKFRGWICQSCNHAIGKLGDNLSGVMQAVLYLSKVNAPN